MDAGEDGEGGVGGEDDGVCEGDAGDGGGDGGEESVWGTSDAVEFAGGGEVVGGEVGVRSGGTMCLFSIS